MMRSRSLFCSIALSLFCCFSAGAMNESFPDQDRFKNRQNVWKEKSEIIPKTFTIEKLDGDNKFVGELNKKFEFYKKLSAYPLQIQCHKEFVAIINFFIQELNKKPNDKCLQHFASYAFFMVHLAYGFSLYEGDLHEPVVFPILETCYSLADYYVKNYGKKQSMVSYFFSFFPLKPEYKIILEFVKILGWYNENFDLKKIMTSSEFINSISLYEKFIEHDEYFKTLTCFRENLLIIIKKETAEKQELTIDKTPVSFIIKQTLKTLNINIIDEPNLINLEEFDLNNEKHPKQNEVVTKITLEDCLSNFFGIEELSNKARWHCATCNSFVESTKSYALKTYPDNLCITLKRFAVMGEYPKYENIKISTPISIPKNLCIFSEKYELQSFIVHSGSSCDDGHYYAYAKAGNTWYCYNDELVKKMEKTDINNICLGDKNSAAQPYILFYKKILSEKQVVNNALPNKGLKNLGNTCFLNALIQCLSQNEDFVKWLKNGATVLCEKEGLSNKDKDSMKNIVAVFLEIIEQLTDKKGENVVVPETFHSLFCTEEIIVKGEQQDPLETFNNIIQKFWPKGTLKKDDLKGFPFKYELETTLQGCGSSCNHNSVTVDPGAMLSIEISNAIQKNSKNDKKRKREDDKTNCIDKNNKKRNIEKTQYDERTQYDSINQTVYEKKYKNGQNLCGVFAAYNGSLMLLSLVANGMQKSKMIPEMIPGLIDDKIFSDWLTEHFDTLEKNRKRRNSDNAGDFNASEIEEILKRDKIDNVSVVLETKDLEYFKANDKTNVLMGFLINKKLLMCISNYRMAQTPCIVIYNTGNHWISIIICPQGILIADSLGKNRCDAWYVNTISALFNTAVIPDEKKLEKYRKEEQDLRNSKKTSSENIIID